MDFNKGVDQKPTVPVMKTESLAQETLPFVKEENKPVVKVEEHKNGIEVDSEEYKDGLQVEKSDEVPKVKKREDSLKVEEGKGSLKFDQNPKSPKAEENKDTPKIEENKVSLRDPIQCGKSENTPGLRLKIEVKYEEKPLKLEEAKAEAEELMDIEGSNIDRGNLELPSANPVEEVDGECHVTPSQDNGAGVDAFCRDIQRASTPPSDLDASGDVHMTIPDAEGCLSLENAHLNIVLAAERAVTAAPRQIIVKDEPIDMDIDSLLASADTPRPEKRRRIFMEAVVVPFDRSSRAHANADRQVRADMEHQALHDKFELLKNVFSFPFFLFSCMLIPYISLQPKVKKPKDVPVLSLDTVMARLSAHGISLEPYPIDLEPEIRDVTVRRDFMSQEYGGNAQRTYPKIRKEFWEKTGMNSDIDLAESDDEDEAKGAKNSQNKKNKRQRIRTHMWQYQGQYVLAPAESLTVNEWKQQPLNVRRTWAQQLAIKRWGRWIRAEITLRRELGRRPTRAEKKTALMDSDNKFLAVTPEEISKAFDRGEAVIVVSTMKCVGYKADFQRVLAEKMPHFKARSNPKPKPAPLKPSSTKRSVASAPRGKKRARQELEDHDDFEDDSDVVPESEDEDEGPQEIVYRSRGTRSRPIVLG
ncbi:hypothetical protein B0H12DRAFT_1167744 [Mycena haematopus]|nr:hypothetical protein B0H12DRAFT_1167744 [Mycena haematopus]